MRAEVVSTKITTKLRRKRIWLRVMAVVGSLFMLMMCALVAIPVISPSTGADLADALRSIVGPVPVAALESISFQIQDVFNRFRYQASGGQPQITWAAPAANLTGSITESIALSATLNAQTSIASAHVSAPAVSQYLNVTTNAPSNVDTGWQRGAVGEFGVLHLRQ